MAAKLWVGVPVSELDTVPPTAPRAWSQGERGHTDFKEVMPDTSQPRGLSRSRGTHTGIGEPHRREWVPSQNVDARGLAAWGARRPGACTRHGSRAEPEGCMWIQEPWRSSTTAKPNLRAAGGNHILSPARLEPAGEPARNEPRSKSD